jgi:hypothetical protein
MKQQTDEGLDDVRGAFIMTTIGRHCRKTFDHGQSDVALHHGSAIITLLDYQSAT